MPDFDRATPWADTSLAMIAFKRQFTELNDQYWGPLPTELLTERFVREKGMSADLRAALAVTSGNWQRVGHNVETFYRKFQDSRAWARLHALNLLSAAIEQYMNNITRAAHFSDPALVPGFPKAIEGLSLLKRGVNLDFNVSRYSRGGWPDRVSAYRNSFGTVPTELEASVDELNSMQALRNRVAHAFGRSVTQGPYGYLATSTAVRVSQTRLMKWLGIVDKVVKSIDAHLVQDYVGDFETLELYYLWKSDRTSLIRSTRIVMSPSARGNLRGFLAFIAKATNRNSPRKRYWQTLDRYERSV